MHIQSLTIALWAASTLAAPMHGKSKLHRRQFQSRTCLGNIATKIGCLGTHFFLLPGTWPVCNEFTNAMPICKDPAPPEEELSNSIYSQGTVVAFGPNGQLDAIAAPADAEKLPAGDYLKIGENGALVQHRIAPGEGNANAAVPPTAQTFSLPQGGQGTVPNVVVDTVGPPIVGNGDSDGITRQLQQAQQSRRIAVEPVGNPVQNQFAGVNPQPVAQQPPQPVQEEREDRDDDDDDRNENRDSRRNSLRNGKIDYSKAPYFIVDQGQEQASREGNRGSSFPS